MTPQEAAEKIILDNFVNPMQRREEVVKIINEVTADLRRRLLSAAGDDLCRLTPEEIKAYTSGAVKIPPKEQFLPSCERFHDQCAKEFGVMEDCLTLAQLIAENEKLKQELEDEETAHMKDEELLHEAREAARWLLPFLVNERPHLTNACERWPWLKETT